MNRTYLTQRINVTKELIEAYENALLQLITNGVESYTLDTGQSRQTVTRYDIGDLQTKLDALYDRLCVFETRLNGNGVVTARPCW